MEAITRNDSKRKVFCGVDFHKNTSTLCALYEDGKLAEPVSTIKTNLLVKYLSNKDWMIGIEVTGGVNHVAQTLKDHGHNVVLINSNKFRGIGIGGKKTDQRDAQALANALRLGYIPQVHLRSKASREIKSLLTTREHIVQSRVRCINHVRASLREYGITMAVGVEAFYAEARVCIERLNSDPIKSLLLDLLENIENYKKQEEKFKETLVLLTNDNEQIKKLQSIPGVGFLTALAMISVIDDISRFKTAKEFASYLGLVPSVHASANKRMMGSITRSGCEMLRRYLIHGARAWMRYSPKNDNNRIWAEKIKERRGVNKATVALAHRLARISFAILRDQSFYTQTVKKEETVAIKDKRSA